jgi:nucleoside diphosphate kinase
MLQDKGLTIESEGAISSQDIADKKLIDNHYYAIASKATLLKPKDMPVPANKFKDTFGVEWNAALEKGNVYNAMDAAEYLGLDAVGLEKEWRKCKPAGKVVKFGGGFYCAMIDTVEGKDPIYLFNGFFMSMRQKYVSGPGIYYFAVSWSSKDLKWSDFRGKLLGPTNPEDAPKDSVRGTILAQWKELGLASAPNTGDNGVHASASPFEVCSFLLLSHETYLKKTHTHRVLPSE